MDNDRTRTFRTEEIVIAEAEKRGVAYLKSFETGFKTTIDTEIYKL
jgi:hypothetical protein